MTPTIQLDSKDVRKALALFFGVPVSDIIPNRYSFGIANKSVEEIQAKLNEKPVK